MLSSKVCKMPNVAVSAEEKLTVIRGVDQKISLQKHKNRVFCFWESKIAYQNGQKVAFLGEFFDFKPIEKIFFASYAIIQGM